MTQIFAAENLLIFFCVHLRHLWIVYLDQA